MRTRVIQFLPLGLQAVCGRCVCSAASRDAEDGAFRMLVILDGDAMDRRNSHDGQIKTRLEAFLELLDQEEEKE